MLQPVLVRPIGDAEATYELVAGERRWRAALPGRSGRRSRRSCATPTISARSSRHLVENLHRQDLTPLEEAAAYQQLIEDFELTHEQVANRVGKSRSAVTNTLRLMSLPPAIQHLLADGRLSAGHARALLGTPDRALQEQLARLAVGGGLVGAQCSRRRCAMVVCSRRPSRDQPDGHPAGTDRWRRADADDEAARRPGCSSSRSCSPSISTRGSACTMGAQAGQGGDRVRRSRGPRADLPPDDQRSRLKLA